MGIAAEPRRSEIDSSQRGAMPRAGAMPPSSYAARSATQTAIAQQVASHTAGQLNHKATTTAPRPPVQQPPNVARPQPNRPASLTDAPAPSPHPASTPSFAPNASESSSRVVLDRVKVATFGTEATVEVRLAASTGTYLGNATGPAVDGYLLRLAAQASAGAIDSLMAESMTTQSPVRCFVDHAGVVPFGSCLVAIVVVLVSGDGWVEQLVGSALVAGDPRQAIARATLAAVNRRLDRLLRAMP
jgi:hypothetical protein